MVLKPQDVFVMLKLVALKGRPWSYADLGVELGMSVSQLHAAIKRSLSAKLAVKQNDIIRPNIRNLEEFLIHGLKYAFIPEQGEFVRGMPTAYAASPLKKYIVQPSEPPPVWPDAEGEVRGMAFSPLYKLAPKAAKSDQMLYELLVLVDAIRGGRAREIDIAVKELKQRLNDYD